MPLRRYQRAASGPGGVHLAVVRLRPERGHLSSAFRPCRSSRLRRFAPLRASQVSALLGSRPMLFLRQRRPAPRSVSPATDRGVHAVSAPAAMPAVVDPLGTSVSLSADPQGSPDNRLLLQVLPRSCPTLRSFNPRQQPSRPSPVGGALSPLQGAAPVVVWLRTTSSTSLASAGLRALIRCRVQSAEMLSPASPAPCSPGLVPEEGGRSASARTERRSRQRAR